MTIKKIIIHNMGNPNYPPTQTYTPEELVTKLNDGSFSEIFEKEKEKYKHEEEDARSEHTPLDGLHLIGWDICTRCPLRADLQRQEGKA
jgi:hypothetical protein